MQMKPMSIFLFFLYFISFRSQVQLDVRLGCVVSNVWHSPAIVPLDLQANRGEMQTRRLSARPVFGGRLGGGDHGT